MPDTHSRCWACSVDCCTTQGHSNQAMFSGAFVKRCPTKGYLARSIGKACDSWSWGHGFELHIEGRVYFKTKTKTNKKRPPVLRKPGFWKTWVWILQHTSCVTWTNIFIYKMRLIILPILQNICESQVKVHFRNCDMLWTYKIEPLSGRGWE